VSAEVWQPSEEQAVTVSVLSEEEARERAQHSTDTRELGKEEIVRRWLETAFITLDPGLRVSEERVTSALTAIRLPRSLRRDI
jgi:hypothetical protein